jgi:hypothetical protein
MDPDDLDKCDWIPEQDKARLKKLMKEWTEPGKGFVLIAVPPSPEREGFVFLRPYVDQGKN